jgi:hypothetical protein
MCNDEMNVSDVLHRICLHVAFVVDDPSDYRVVIGERLAERMIKFHVHGG